MSLFNKFSAMAAMAGVLAASLAGCAPAASPYTPRGSGLPSPRFQSWDDDFAPSDRTHRRERVRDQKRRADKTQKRRRQRENRTRIQARRRRS